jgi:hypothetical protein
MSIKVWLRPPENVLAYMFNSLAAGPRKDVDLVLAECRRRQTRE